MAKTTKKSKAQYGSPSLTTTRIARTLFIFCCVFALSIVLFDSGNLITREAVIDRWVLVSGLFALSTLVWTLSAARSLKQTAHTTLRLLLVAGLVTFAGYMTYYERGMASSSTIFYVLPLLVAATLKNRHVLMASAALSAGTYTFAAVLYFNTFFNEGYRIQLWGNILLYVGTIFVSAWLIMIIAGLRRDSI